MCQSLDPFDTHAVINGNMALPRSITEEYWSKELTQIELFHDEEDVA